MITVRSLLKTKGHDVWSIDPDASVFDALKLMAEKDVGALLVLKDGKLVGIFSERDYARKVILEGKSSKNTPVAEIMTSQVYYVKSDQSIEDCMAMMTEKRIRHLPVIESGELIGVVSIGDIVKAIIDEQEFIIEQLENYITGTR